MTRLQLFLLALFVTIASPVSATTVVELELDDLVKLSDAIVVADVTKTEAFLDEGRVFTRIHLSVREVWKGEKVDEVTIVHLGGRTEQLATRVHGMPTFTVGERAVVFLERPKGFDHYVVTGLSQGKFSVTEREDGTSVVVPQTIPSSIARHVNLPDGKKKLTLHADTAVPGPRTLPALRAEVDALSKRQAKTK